MTAEQALEEALWYDRILSQLPFSDPARGHFQHQVDQWLNDAIALETKEQSHG